LIWNAYLRGQVLLALIIGIVVAVVLSVLGVSNALALGLLSGVLEFLPIIGPVIGTAAAVLVAVFQSSNYLGLSPLIYGLLVLGVMIAIQQIENHVLVPRIVGGALDLHPVAVMVGVLMGASLAGLLGAILAAPVLATLKLFAVYVWRKMLDLDPFPESDSPEEQVEPATGPRWFGIPSWIDKMMSKRQ
jgi:predicted PurR-regulated permease PerM